MEFTSKLDRVGGEVWYYCVPVPDEVAENFIDGDDKRVICTLEGKVSYNAGILSRATGYFINVNDIRRKKLGLVLGQLVHVSLEKDTSEYGMPMSEELREVLNQEEKASALFHALTPGRQRTLIYWADNVKSPEIKIRRALVMTQHLVEQNGVPDFKLMNSAMKEANQRAKGLL